MPAGRILAYAATCLAGLLSGVPPVRAHVAEQIARTPPGEAATEPHHRNAAHHHATKHAHATRHSRRKPTATNGVRQLGKASWYGSRHVHKNTASGERFDANRLTAAHPTLPMNTRVRVTNLANGKVVTVTVNDRSRPSGYRVIDLSPRAADALDMKKRGLVPVIVEVLPTKP